MFFSSKGKLIRALDSLAIYNDKGIAWWRHTPEQSEAQRCERMEKIENLISKVGEGALPPEFLKALRSGVLATDDTGLYVDKLKKHFRRHR
jgi:hypothetical protein